jgi:hypothetical protein
VSERDRVKARSASPILRLGIGLAVSGRPIGPWSQRTGAPQASATRRDRNQPWRSVRIYRATTLTAPGRVTLRRTIGSALGEQIAADLLPEAGDSRAVEGGEGL